MKILANKRRYKIKSARYTDSNGRDGLYIDEVMGDKIYQDDAGRVYVEFMNGEPTMEFPTVGKALLYLNERHRSGDSPYYDDETESWRI